MKKSILASYLFCAYFLHAQNGSVGINTTTPNSSAVLDLYATDKGLLIPRVSLQNGTDTTTIPLPAKGLIIYNTNSSLSNGEGLYVNYGTPSSPQWYTFAPYTNTNYSLDNAYSSTAMNQIVQNVPGTPSALTINNVDLGLGITIVIPAFTNNQIIVTYSTPIGLLNNGIGDIAGYMGIRFLKNGVEASGGSRKYSIPQVLNSTTIYTMVSVGATYVETIANNTSSPMTVTYSLNGYIEKTSGTRPSTPVLFNMFETSTQPNNFNWGKGTISAQVFRKAF